MEITSEDLKALFEQKYRSGSAVGPGPQLRLRFQYFTPDDIYEATVSKLVQPGCSWLDVGSGRDIFPGNAPLAYELAARCGCLTGVDPSDNIDSNPFLHERVKCAFEDFESCRRFDLVTFRMVVEHVENPRLVLRTLARVGRLGGKVVVYTVNKWSPVPLLSRIIPFAVHHRIKSFIWRTEERDTFPVVYAMNTRRNLKRQFAEAGFCERLFAYLDDCRTFARFPLLDRVELTTEMLFRKIGISYPENCLLGIYERFT